MSLLLKALQNAAKNREAGATGEEPSAAQVPASSEGSKELSLEPIIEPAASSAGPAGSTEPSIKPRAASETAARSPERNPSRTQAQNVFRAGAGSAALPERASPGIVEWLTRRPLIAFSTAAGLFAIGYGVYLYLQLTNPGIFVARPNPAASPPPPPPVASAPAPQVPAPVASTPQAVSPPEPALPGGSQQAPIPPAAVVPPSVAQPNIGAAPQAASPTAAAPAAPAGGTVTAAEKLQPSATTTSSGPAAAPTTPPPTASASVPTKRAPIAVAATPAEAPRTPRTAAPAPRASTPSARGRPGPTPAVAATATASVNSDLLSAYQALEKGQLNDAERLYRQALAADPRNVDAMIGLGATLTHQNRADAAMNMYLRVLEVDPRNSYAQAGLLSINGRADPQAAEGRLKQLIANEPSAYLYFILGNLYAEQNQWAAAQGAYFQAFNMAPDNPDYAFNLAVGLEHLSQPKLALDYYRRAVSVAQSRGNAQFALAPVQARIRSLEAALAERP